MRTFTGLSILLLTILAHGPASAETLSIRCPLPDATRRITEQLPTGWWTTPVINRLTATRVQKMNGKTALICLYGDSGSIQRNAPAGRNCRTISDGFRCTGDGAAGSGSSSAATRVVASAGTITVRESYKFDLDRGREQSQGADFWFQARSRTRLFLTPQNNALVAVMSQSAPGYDGCAGARFSQDRVPIRKLPVGSYVCAKTSDGRVSQFRILAIARGHPTTLRIRFTTWR